MLLSRTASDEEATRHEIPDLAPGAAVHRRGSSEGLRPRLDDHGIARFGYSAGFCMLIGVLEIAGGDALLVRSVARYGVLLLLAIMAGATWTLVQVGDSPIPPLVIGTLLAIVAATQLRSTSR